MTVVRGVDHSLTGTGVSDGERTWIVRSSGRQDATLLQRRERLIRIADEVLSGIPIDTDLVCIEGPSFGSKSLIGTHDRAGLWWLIVDGLLDAGIRVVEVPPASLKTYATGKGTAGKPQMLAAAIGAYPEVETGSDDNRVDALWLAAAALEALTGISRVTTERQHDALRRVRGLVRP